MIRQTVLDNGITVATNSFPAGSTAVGWTLHAGTANEPEGYHGAAHAFEHVACNIERIMKPVERMGCDFSAGTNHEMIRMEAEVWSGRAKDTLTRLLVHGLAEPDISDAGWQREQPRILMEIMEDRQDRMACMMQEADAYMFGKAPRSRSVLGTAQEVQELDPEKLRWFHRHVLTGPAITICAAGDIRHDTVVREAERRLGHLPRHALEAPPPSHFRADGMGLLRDDLPGNEVMVQYRGVARGAPANPVYRTLQLMLCSDMQSYMFNRLSFREGLVYGLTGDMESWKEDGVLRFNLTTSREKSQQALDSFASQMARMPEKPVDWIERASLDLPRYGHVRTMEEIREALNAVTLEQVRAAAGDMLAQGAFVTAMGKVEDLRIIEPFSAAQARRQARLPYQPA